MLPLSPGNALAVNLSLTSCWSAMKSRKVSAALSSCCRVNGNGIGLKPFPCKSLTMFSSVIPIISPFSVAL